MVEGILECLPGGDRLVVRYRVTLKGETLARVVRELQLWADAWAAPCPTAGHAEVRG